MEEQHIKQVEESFRKVAVQGDAFIRRFYERLFATHQDVAAFFTTTDMESQRRKLLLMMIMVVDNLRDSAYLDRSMKDLMIQHKEMAVNAMLYAKMNSVFIDTVAEFMGAEWDDQYQHAWEHAFDKITHHMLDTA